MISNKMLYNMYGILAVACGIGAIVFGYLATSKKDKIDDEANKKIEQADKARDTKISKISYDTASARYFQENESNFINHDNVFTLGYYIYHQSPDYDKPFKKSYGSELIKDYIDFSNAKIVKPEELKGKRSESEIQELQKQKIEYVLEYEVDYAKSGNHISKNTSAIVDVKIGPENILTLQTITVSLPNFGAPKYELLMFISLFNDSPPFTYLIGPIEKKTLREMERQGIIKANKPI